MPLYEYTCKSCGHHFDALRSFSDADKIIPCRKCESTNTQRGISLFFAQSDGRSMTTQSSGGCGGCSGGSCGSCHH